MGILGTPDKIYLYPSDRVDEEYEDEWGDLPWGEDYVEYIRKDTFIDKVCNFIAENMKCDGYTLQTKAKFIKYFRTYMEGE